MNTWFIDTHCHLDFAVFDEKRSDILQNCMSHDVRQMIIPGVSQCRWDSILGCVRENKGLYAALGIHPGFIGVNDILLEPLQKKLEDNSDIIVAIGEIGLDYFSGDSGDSVQSDVFNQQVILAKELKLPLILHVRKAHDEVTKIIKQQHFTYGGIVHCYSGSLQQAGRYLDLGFRLGIGGVITYERSHRLQKIISVLPLSSFVLESDAPDIPICGKEHQPNSPEYIPHIFKSFCNYRSESTDILKEKVFLNTLELFPKLKA